MKQLPVIFFAAMALLPGCAKDDQSAPAKTTATSTSKTVSAPPAQSSDALMVYQAFGKELSSGSEAWKDYVADDIQFTGPVDQVTGKEAFVALNNRFMPSVRGNTVKNVVTSGNWVITQQEMQVAMNSGKTIVLDMNEWWQVEDGKITSIKIYYDAEQYRSEGGCIGSTH